LASAERSGILTGGQVNDIAQGRDFFALLNHSGVVDTTGSRDINSNTARAGIFINGIATTRERLR
jgi:hypothetical protein